MPGQLIHQSVFEEMSERKAYEPKALTHEGTAWDKTKMPLEKDPYSDASDFLGKLRPGLSNRAAEGLVEEDILAIDALTSTGE